MDYSPVVKGTAIRFTGEFSKGEVSQKSEDIEKPSISVPPI